MKTRKSPLPALLAAACLAVASVHAQTNPPPVLSSADFISALDHALQNLNTNINLFAAREFELKLGGVYAQSTGEGGVVTDIEHWGLIKPDIGLGVQLIEGSNRQVAGTVAAFAYAEYRKSLGNVALGGLLGAGYDKVNNAPLGVVALRLYYRTSAHIGIWAGIGYALENSGKDRGLLAGGGLSYSF